MVFVNKEPVPRQQWLNGIKDEFEMHQDQIDVFKIQAAKEIKAASLIARYCFRWKRKVQAQKEKKDEDAVQSQTSADAEEMGTDEAVE